jgi:predicted Rossmann fold flavoprotein
LLLFFKKEVLSSPSVETTEVLILGAGAAGLMCALTAGQRGRRVVVVDHARQPGEKILISGGGRCNFTNLHTAPDRFFSQNPAFCRSALARYTPGDFLELVARHAIPWHEKTLGQLFCDGSARAIVAMLLAECAAGGVQIRLQQRITDVTRGDLFHVETDAGPITAESLVLATGGLSIPKLGATGLSHEIATRFGLPLTAIRPALVPLTLPPADLAPLQSMAGVSAEIIARCGRVAFREGMVITHRGLSGPAILQISSAWREDAPIDIDLLPSASPGFLAAHKRTRPRTSLRTALAEALPQRLADAFLPTQHEASRMADIPDRALQSIETGLRHWRLHPSGTEGYAKAEVTLGGIDTRALDQRTMQAREVEGLYVIGEAVDVTGWLGGYNFQWAWASGYCAGEAA